MTKPGARTAIVTTSWPRFDGDPSGHFVRAEARALARCGDDVTVIAPGADVDAFGWPGFEARVRERPLRALGAVAWVARARRDVERGGFDRVVAHWAVPSAWPVASRHRSALEVVSHGADVRLLASLPPPLASRVVRDVASRATTWRFVAAHLLDRLLARAPRDVARAVERLAVVAPCAIEVDAPDAQDVAAKRARFGEPFAACVARLVPSKRVDAAVAWAASTRVPLVVVGDGPERARLESLAARAGARVTFAGRVPRSEALAWIAAATWLAHASREEGASTVVREAEALGTRVVCTM